MKQRRLLGSATLGVALVGILLVTSLAGASGPFTDDDGSVHEADIERLAALGVTKGCNPPTNDKFCPDDPVTRGQMAAFLHRALDGVLTPGPTPEYTDDNNSVFETDIEWLGATGVTKGCNPPTNDKFCPDDPVTRGQMAAFLHRALDGVLTPGPTPEYTDDNNSVFETDIEWLGATGVTKGCNPPTNDKFCPDDPVTRGQMAAFLMRSLDQLDPPSTTSTSTGASSTTSTSTSSTSSSSTTTTAPPADGPWIDVVDGAGPRARHEAGLVAVGDMVYLMGGRGTRPTQSFDLSGGSSWTDMGPTTTQFHHFQPVTVAGTVYLPGAMEGNCCTAEVEMPVTNLKVFDPTTGNITNGPAIPPANRRGASGAVAHDGWIYQMGGVTGGHGDTDNTGGAVTQNLLTMDRYNPSTNTWESLPDIPRKRDHFHAALVGDKIYLIGGRASENPGFWNQSAQVTQVDVYDISAGTWTTPTNIPVERAGAMTAVVGTDIYIIGGEGGTGHSGTGDLAHGRVDILHTINMTWTTADPIDPPRHGTGAIVCAGDIYVAAGSETRGGNGEVNDFAALDTADDELGCHP